MNLVEVINNQLANGTINQLSSLIGAGEGATRSAVSAAVPTVLSALSGVASSKGGAEKLISALGKFDAGSLGGLGNMLSDQPGTVLEQGSGLLKSLFGGGTITGITNALAGFAGLGSGTIQKLLGYLLPMVLGGIAGRFAGKALNAQGLASMLADQKANIATAMPSGLSLRSVPGLESVNGAARQAASAVQQTGLSLWRWLAPVLGVGLAALLFWWFLGPRTGAFTVPKPANIPSPSVSVPNVAQLSTDLTGTFKSLTETLTGIKDAASAEAALPTLTELNTKLESAGSVVERLPEAGKATINGLTRATLDKLRVLVGKVLALAGVGDKIKPIVDAIMNNVKALAG
jgi:hypothetical protein